MLGVWLTGDADPAELADDLVALQLIAIDFQMFTDGRGYSIATLLRTRYGYVGELRAIGNVLCDQFFFMIRFGFSTPAAARGQVQPSADQSSAGQPWRLLRFLPKKVDGSSTAVFRRRPSEDGQVRATAERHRVPATCRPKPTGRGCRA